MGDDPPTEAVAHEFLMIRETDAGEIECVASRKRIVVEHLLNQPLGLIHILAALAAMLFGAAVVVARKGTRRHRWMCRGYFFMMLALNATALLNYELYGRWIVDEEVSDSSLYGLLRSDWQSRTTP